MKIFVAFVSCAFGLFKQTDFDNGGRDEDSGVTAPKIASLSARVGIVFQDSPSTKTVLDWRLVSLCTTRTDCYG